MKRRLMGMLAVFSLTLVPVTAQDFDGKKVAAALTQKNISPASRLPDGHPDLGNASGSWEPPGLGDMAGTGGGFAGTAQPEKKIDMLQRMED